MMQDKEYLPQATVLVTLSIILVLVFITGKWSDRLWYLPIIDRYKTIEKHAFNYRHHLETDASVSKWTLIINDVIAANIEQLEQYSSNTINIPIDHKI